MSREELVQKFGELIWTRVILDREDADKVAELIAPEVERLLAAERERVRRMCCRVMCFRCAEGNKPFDNGTTWLHLLEKKVSSTTKESWNEDCEAAAIRQLDLTKDLAPSREEEEGISNV